ncbi:DUF7537 family lipoprotein [Halobaculum magnesiiphilum]|uniref:Uncharacterized protein n=1 Tax=Halobaculum magnesiiphilum TaxID=1017351 RepID=A0A8T8WDW7_9EURY|nr:hypothetical protein [Halobaculum magnesiiphilum]QZP38049.1 hypothetical protein K6T50_02495 [Halobaculum magnesiiphilum]
MRRPAAVLACLCLVLAGCGATGSPGGDARTVAPALAGTPTPTATPETPVRPPGVNASASGIDRRALVAAHEEALDGRSVTVRTSRRVVADDGTVILDGFRRSRTDGLAQFFSRRITETPYRRADGRTFNVSYWRNDTVTVRRWPDGNRSVTLDTDFPTRQLFDRTGAAAVETILSGYELQYAGTTTRDGETLHVLTEASAEQRYRPLRTNVCLRVLVTGEGVVRSITATYRTDEYGRSARVTVEFRVTNVSDTEVPRPEWVDEALAEDG